MKKILIFSLAYFPMVGGAEVAIKEITDRITDCEFDIVTKNFGASGFEKIGNINVYRVWGLKLFFPFIAFFKARRLNKKNNYDAIWSIMANRAGFAALFFKFFHPKIKFLLTLQEGDELDYPQKRMGIIYFFLKPFFKKIFIKADKIQAISNYLADWAKKMGAEVKKIEVVPNGVDIEKFKSQISNFKNKEDKILITVSRLVKKNAVNDIIEALKFLPANIKLLILGVGPEEEKLKSLVASYNLENRVNFVGLVKSDEISSYLHSADIFVRPSLSEGLGNAFLEAMAASVPVIATSVGGIPDFLINGQTGLFCEVNNPQDIAEKVKLYLNDNNLRNKIIINAKQMVGEKYDWNLISLKIRNILNQ
jgi:glycosyltransferase involved in cell wall biosynthesis